MNRRGFLKLLAAAAPALVLTKDFVLPVDTIAPWTPTIARQGTAVGLRDLTARMATLVADHLAGHNLVAVPGDRLWGDDVRLPVPDLPRFIPDRIGLPVPRYDTRRLAHHYVCDMPDLSTVGQRADLWLEPAAELIANIMREDDARVTAPLALPFDADAAIVTRGGLTIRGLAMFDPAADRPLVHTRFDVLYG